mgnify:FL=1
MQRILVDQANIRSAHLASTPDAALGEGQARLTIESFSLTTNNVTYSATGDVLKYWQFFPSGQSGQGIVPVWGTAHVSESRAACLPIGTRLYGYLPMADHLVITPEQTSAQTFSDIAPHRAGLAAVYNSYTEVAPANPRSDALRALLQPLLATSWLLADWLADNAFFEADQIIIGSASSKTGLGLCKFLKEISPRPFQIVGLTSQSNTAFVESLGACDLVLPYDALETLPPKASVYVDMAGNAAVKSRLHHHLGATLKHSAAVGTSHWDQFAPPQNLPGPKPQFFCAPAQIAKRRAEWGAGEINRQITAAWQRIANDAADWLDIIPHSGLAAAPALWTRLASGAVPPREGHILHVSPPAAKGPLA